MAISSETVRAADSAGNNSTSTPYVIPFAFLANADVIVVVRTSAGVETQLVEITDYVITGSGYPTASASFTTAVAVPASSTVIIYRRTTVTQTTQYVEADEFPAASHERALDKLTMQEQEGKDIDQHSFRLKDSRGVISALTPVNNALIGLNPVGVPIFQTATEVMAWLNLVTTVFNMPTKAWLDAAARALAVPDFLGQLGMQRDTMVTYMGTALTAGSWVATTAAGLADGSVTTPKLLDGVLSADAAGRLKMAAAFLMATHLNKDAVSGQTAKTLLEDADRLLGWSSADDALRYFAGNVVVPPGSIVQTQVGTYALNANLTSVIPNDNTIPQIGEGTQIISVAITPRFADSMISLTFSGEFALNIASAAGVAAAFRNSVSNAIGGRAVNISGVNFKTTLHFNTSDLPAATTAQTYTVRAGPNVAATMRFNGDTAGRELGGVQTATLVVQEIKV